MRRRQARLLAIGAGAVVLALAALVAAVRGRPPAPTGGSASGLATYERLGCPTCHALGGRGNPRLPLDGVGGRLSPDAIRTWIVAPQRMDPAVRKPAYDREPPADIDAVVELLAGS